MDKVTIIETTTEDLDNVVSLWNNGEVMHYVGFPNGLGVTKDQLLNKWLKHINVSPKRKHYSIYHESLGYCGESYYSVEEDGRAALDIKLLPRARGKGIAKKGLEYAIMNAFEIGKAKTVYVDPNKDNVKAIALYKKLGFIEHPHPNQEYKDTNLYFELTNNI
jgi:RimJ/RimL family protein N-acetyltransferase